jgi:F-type H+-transporting ATPase subunit delta
MVELVAKRYGSALFELAVETNQVEFFKEQLQWIKDVFHEEKDFTNLLNHPKVIANDKIAMIENVFEGKVSKEILGLLVVSIKKGRASNLLDIINYCINEIDDYEGNAKAYVTSAISLTDKQIDDIKKRLEETTSKKIILKLNVDESLIGGLIIRIGDRIVDNSIRGKIEAISKELYAI